MVQSPAWSNPIKTPHVEVELLTEVDAIKPSQPLAILLNFQIRSGWHTYWQNPGDSGAPPRIDWKLPPGFKAGPLQLPSPKRISYGPLVNFGFKEQTFILTEIMPPPNLDQEELITIEANAEWLVCEEECIPETATFTLTLPVSETGSNQQNFDQFRQQLPQILEGLPEFQEDRATDSRYLTLAIPELSDKQVTDVAFFPFQDGIIENRAAQTYTIENDRLTVALKSGYNDLGDSVEGVVVIDTETGKLAFLLDAPVKPALIQSDNSTPSQNVLQVMGFALLGGILLNFMPCVFPVLSLKALKIAHQAHQTPRSVRMQSLVFSLGILTSFAILGTSLLLLRATGQQIGWGFQLQSPGFVLLLMYVLLLVGLNLSGVFVFGASWMGIGQGLTAKNGWMGEFFSGVLTTVMATPCTAPFMATAIGVGLSQPWHIAMTIMLMLGLGLSLPHLLLSLLPGLQRMLPKPGAWMETLQQFLAFPVYGAAAWLLWVLTQQTGAQGLGVALIGAVTVSCGAWLYGKTQTSTQFWKRLGTVSSLGMVTFCLVLATWLRPVSAPIGVSPSQWQPYSADVLTELLGQDKPVFVNFTAAWCASCLVNEQTTLGQPEVLSKFASKGVTLLKADWTNRNGEITQALEQFGRSGVPLYVLYPDRSKAVVLPHLLSPKIVDEYLQKLPNPKP